MSQQKSTSFSAARVANFRVVMAEMIAEKLRMEKEIKRLQHHVSVLSNRNHQLMKDDKSSAVASIASATSLCPYNGGKEEKEEMAEEKGRLNEVVTDSEADVVARVATVEAEDEAEIEALEVESVAGEDVVSDVFKESLDVSMSGDVDKVVVVDRRLRVVASKKSASMSIGICYGSSNSKDKRIY